MSEKPLKLAIAGLGTVGAGVVKLLQEQQDLLRHRCTRSLEIVAVSARDPKRNRGLNLEGIEWVDDPLDLATHGDVDIVVELIGGSDGIAKDVVEKSLSNGKSVVTANKSLMAYHGPALAALAEENNAQLFFEAAVAGGIPLIKTLREGLAANAVDRFHGILNGTANYILTTMEKTGASFDDVLSEAQRLGYAEADPTFDVDGFDTAHKLAILGAIAFGTKVNLDDMPIEGIRQITLQDVHIAAELGYRIKLLGIAEKKPNGISLCVHPCLVAHDASIALVDDVYNAAVLMGDYVGQVTIEGRGAGGNPTASAVVADLIDLANTRHSPVYGRPVTALEELDILDPQNMRSSYYVRLSVADEPGVAGRITQALGNEDVSIKTLLQREEAQSGPVPVILTTHRCKEKEIHAALKAIEDSGVLKESPMVIRVMG